MRVPQVSERIKEAPAQALRGVFAGIGQLLLYTDKLRNKTPYARVPAAPPSPAAAPRAEPTAPVSDHAAASTPIDRDVVAAEPAAAETPKTPRAPRAPKTPKTPAAPKTPAVPTEIRDFDKTGNVRLITADEARKGDEPAGEEPGTQAPAGAGEPAAGPAQAGPPLPNYDELSIASLRARLKNLDVTQVRGLVEYEKAHAGRADVIVMFERRIAKLEAGD